MFRLVHPALWRIALSEIRATRTPLTSVAGGAPNQFKSSFVCSRAAHFALRPCNPAVPFRTSD